MIAFLGRLSPRLDYARFVSARTRDDEEEDEEEDEG